MCLYVSKKETNAMLVRESGWIKCYKIYLFTENKEIAHAYHGGGPDLTTNEIVMDNPYSAAVIAGLRKGRVVHAGIHVYTGKQRAKYETYRDSMSSVCVTVWGHVSDLIAVSNTYNREAVFTKIRIDCRDYQKMLNHVHGKDKYTTEFCD